MEIREEKGWGGVTGDVVLYDGGVIRKGDVVVTAGLEGACKYKGQDVGPAKAT